MRSVIQILALPAAILGSAPDGLGATLLVDRYHPQARESGAGAGTPEAPFSSITAALKRVAPGDIVRIKSGRYPESVQLTVSGSPAQRVTVEGWPGERVVIDGADAVTGWEKADTTPQGLSVFSAPLPNSPAMVFVGDEMADRVDNTPNVPGQYSTVRGANGEFRLLVCLPAGETPESAGVAVTRRRWGVRGDPLSHVTLRNLEVARFAGSGITLGGGVSNVVDGCLVHSCRIDPFDKASFGISFAGQRGSTVRRCISVQNSYGIAVSGSHDCTIEENATGRHIVDALLVSWRSSGITLRRNYIFDNWEEKHPDGFQTYRDVRRLTLDSNVFLNVGQGWQCQETQDGTVVNNIWAGIHWGYAISCSLRHSAMGITNLNLRFTNNTFFGGTVLTGGRSTFHQNVVVPPALGGVPGVPALSSDDNLVWTDQTHLFRWRDASGREQKSRDFREYQRATGDNLNSRFAAPQFRNGPVLDRSLFKDRGGKDVPPERERLYIGSHDGFRVGDWLEVDCDGVPRQVVRLENGYAVIDPPCTVMPRGSLSFVWNWKTQTNFLPDLRLKDGAPGTVAGGSRKPAGSDVNLQEYARGDFDADGQQDLPKLAPGLLSGHPLLRLASWNQQIPPAGNRPIPATTPTRQP